MNNPELSTEMEELLKQLKQKNQIIEALEERIKQVRLLNFHRSRQLLSLSS